MTLDDYRAELRIAISDYNTLIQSHHSDEYLRQYINDARKYVNDDLNLYEKQTFINLITYRDEYALPTDFKSMIGVLNMDKPMHMPGGQRSTTRNAKFNWANLYSDWSNQFITDERTKKLILLKPPESTEVHPIYTISAFDRTNLTCEVNAVNTGDLSSIAAWDLNLKPVCKLTTSRGSVNSGVEYFKVTKIVPVYTLTVITSYKLYFGADDMDGNNCTSVKATGYFTASGNALTGHNTMMLNELKVGDSITINGNTRIINSVISNVSATFAGSTLSIAQYSNAYITRKNNYDNYTVTGTGVISASGNDFTGTGTQFTVECVPGDVVTIGGEGRAVLNVSSDVGATFSGDTLSVTNQPYTITRLANDTLQFTNLILNYKANPKKLVFGTDEDDLPMEMQELVISRAGYIAFTRESRPDKANEQLNEYNTRKQHVIEALCEDAAAEANAGGAVPGYMYDSIRNPWRRR